METGIISGNSVVEVVLVQQNDLKPVAKIFRRENFEKRIRQINKIIYDQK